MFLALPMTDDALRALPSVDALLQHPHIDASVEMYGRPLTIAAVRETLHTVRAKLVRNGGMAPGRDELARDAVRWLGSQTSPTLRPVINATGVIIHTNLGRAPLSVDALQAMLDMARDYNTIEYNIVSGRRSERFNHLEKTLCQLTGAEGGLVVNNNAAALLLVLTALARRKGVVISRSQLVEIGGGFRVPDVMKQSGAKLIEVAHPHRQPVRRLVAGDLARAVGIMAVPDRLQPDIRRLPVARGDPHRVEARENRLGDLRSLIHRGTRVGVLGAHAEADRGHIGHGDGFPLAGDGELWRAGLRKVLRKGAAARQQECTGGDQGETTHGFLLWSDKHIVNIGPGAACRKALHRKLSSARRKAAVVCLAKAGDSHRRPSSDRDRTWYRISRFPCPLTASPCFGAR